MSEENNNDGQNQNDNGKKNVKDKFNAFRSNIENFLNDVNVDDLKKSFTSLMKEAQKDLHRIVDKDLEEVKQTLHVEKVQFEKKAKQFMEQNKKELDVLQSKLDKLVKTAREATAKAGEKVRAKATKKKPTTTKKAASKAGPSTKKKATKKASKKS